MRLLKFLLLVLFLVSFKGEGTIDKRLIGQWEGSEKDQQFEGVEKKWIMERKSNGEFILHFTYIEDGTESKTIEKGKWYTKNGLFYEYHNDSKKTDIYMYEVLDQNRVKFTSKKSHFTKYSTEPYTFIDTRITNNL